MGEYLHRLAEELRTREQYLEDHNDHPIFAGASNPKFRADFERLKDRVSTMRRKVDKANKSDEEIDPKRRDAFAGEGNMIRIEIARWERIFN